MPVSLARAACIDERYRDDSTSKDLRSKIRCKPVVPVQVLSFYPDPIRPQPEVAIAASLPGCRVSTHPTEFLGHFTHHAMWVSGTAKSTTPRGVLR